MCNLYSLTKGQAAIRALARALNDRCGNLASQPAIFPDQMAPVVRQTAQGREILPMRWGFPPPSAGRPVTNIRNTASPYWRAWMQPAQRVLVPATSFCEYLPGKPAVPHWFALGQDRPLFCFAGLWRPWQGVRGKTEGAHELFAFLTTEPNAEVARVHPKSMPVILTDEQAMDQWLEGSVAEALSLQRPLADGALGVVATGTKHDG